MDNQEESEMIGYFGCNVNEMKKGGGLNGNLSRMPYLPQEAGDKKQALQQVWWKFG